MSAFSWTEESMAVLREATRKFLFDFEKVAVDVRSQFSHLSCEVSANDCRKLYAEEYISHPARENETETANIQIEDSMTFDQIMDVVEIRNERSEKRKQKVFSRVLASLGSITTDYPHEVSTEMETMRTNLADKKLLKQREQERKEKNAAEHDEMCWIVKEREKLRERHLPGSIDSEGEGAFPYHFPVSAITNGSEQKDLTLMPGTPHTVEKEDSSPGGIIFNYDFDAAGLFKEDSLDLVLEQIEKELDARAGGKEDPPEDRSELFEVLAILDRAAAEKKRPITLQVTPPRPSSITLTTATVVAVEVGDEVVSSLSDNGLVESQIQADLGDQQERTVESLDPQSIRIAAATVVIPPIPPTESIAKRPHGGRGGRGGRGRGSYGQAPAGDRYRDSNDVDSSDDDDDDSLDDDWAQTRSNIKSKAILYRPSLSPLPSLSPSSVASVSANSSNAGTNCAAAIPSPSSSSSSFSGCRDSEIQHGSVEVSSDPAEESPSSPSPSSSGGIIPNYRNITTAAGTPQETSPTTAQSDPEGSGEGGPGLGLGPGNQVSGSLLTGRSGAVGRKKLAPRVLLHTASVVPDSKR